MRANAKKVRELMGQGMCRESARVYARRCQQAVLCCFCFGAYARSTRDRHEETCEKNPRRVVPFEDDNGKELVVGSIVRILPTALDATSRTAAYQDWTVAEMLGQRRTANGGKNLEQWVRLSPCNGGTWPTRMLVRVR